jgi:hypothetical protein
MLNIDRALGDYRLIKAINGLSASEFNKLIERFREEFQNEAQARYETGVELGNREQKPGGGRIGNLGFLFDLDRSNAHRNAHKLASILEKALSKEMVLPPRKISTVEELLEAFPNVRDLLIDGTERPIQRPKDDEKQKELTDDAKAWNRIVSGFRVLVEHAIGGVKRFGIVSDKFRNRKDGFDDKVMVISCGLWIYHLKFC